MRKYRKPHQIKKKKPIFKKRFFWIVILILITFLGFFYLIYFSPFFQIKQINISGNQKVSFEELNNLIKEMAKNQILFFETKSIFLVNFNKINTIILKRYLQVNKINLKRKFPDILEVQIEERKPIACIVFGEQENENYFLIDKEGIIYEKISVGQERNLLKIRDLILSKEIKLGEQIIKKEEISSILKVQSNLNNDLKITIKEILLVSEERLNVKTEENWEIYFNLKEDLDWQLTKVNTVLEKEILQEKRKDLEYIDVRFGNSVSYKYKYRE